MKKLIFALAVLAMTLPLVAEIYKIEGLWYNPEKTTKIQFYQAPGGTYEGKVAWQKESTENGKPKVDKDNPDKSLRSRQLQNMVVAKNLKSRGNNKYDGGTIYDPTTGKTYSSKIELTGPNTMRLRGYVGVSLLGKTMVWTRAAN